jgi:hypothetical protein
MSLDPRLMESVFFMSGAFKACPPVFLVSNEKNLVIRQVAAT